MLKKTETALVGIILAALLYTAVGSVFGLPRTDYSLFTFGVAFGLLYIVYIAYLHNYFSLILLGMLLGLAGVFLKMTGKPNADAALLVGKVSVSVFVIITGIRLYRRRQDIEEHQMLYVVLLVLMAALTAGLDITDVDAFSLLGFGNYMVVGVIINILWNDYLSTPLLEGERKVLTAYAMHCFYSIALMIVAAFA